MGLNIRQFGRFSIVQLGYTGVRGVGLRLADAGLGSYAFLDHKGEASLFSPIQQELSTERGTE